MYVQWNIAQQWKGTAADTHNHMDESQSNYAAGKEARYSRKHTWHSVYLKL